MIGHWKGLSPKLTANYPSSSYPREKYSQGFLSSSPFWRRRGRNFSQLFPLSIPGDPPQIQYCTGFRWPNRKVGLAQGR